MGLNEQKKVLNDIVSDVRHIKSALETSVKIRPSKIKHRKI